MRGEHLCVELERRLGIVRSAVVVSSDAAGGRCCCRGLAVHRRAVSYRSLRRRGARLRRAEQREARTHPVQRVVRLRRADSDGEDYARRRTGGQGPQRHVRPVRQDLAATRQEAHIVDEHQEEKPQPAMERSLRIRRRVGTCGYWLANTVERSHSAKRRKFKF